MLRSCSEAQEAVQKLKKSFQKSLSILYDSCKTTSMPINRGMGEIYNVTFTLRYHDISLFNVVMGNPKKTFLSAKLSFTNMKDTSESGFVPSSGLIPLGRTGGRASGSFLNFVFSGIFMITLW